MLNLLDPASMIANALPAHSYRHFHARDVHYACVNFSKELTVKIYELPDSRGEFIVAPHQHRYPFLQVVLLGELYNFQFQESRDPEKQYWMSCAYKTPLNGGEGQFLPVLPTGLKAERYRYYRPGQGYTQQPNVIHTIATYRRTWVVTWQGADEWDDAMTFFKRNEVPKRSDRELYQPMTRTDLEDMAQRYLEDQVE